MANAGLLQKITKGIHGSLVETDVSKAYASAFSRLTEVPVFSEFDNFRKYRQEPIMDYNLYVVKSSRLDMFCNKKYNLCYGKFLGDVVDCEILAYKRPSFIKKVDYKDILDELWKRKISTIPEEDTKIKKLIANVNFGLLEKGKNTAIKTHVFETLDEAKTNQAKYGGVVNYIRKYLSEEVEEEDDHGNKEIRLKHTQEGKEYYVLNVQDTAVLRDGFRYIKELLLQEFNSKLNKDYQALIGQGVKVYSVKTDALSLQKQTWRKQSR